MSLTPCRATLRQAFSAFIATAILGSTAFASGPYVIGSSNTVTADPTVPRPSTTPCVVQLLSDAEFDNFNPVSFAYTPPAG